MARAINFVGDRQKFYTKIQKTDRLILNICLGGFAVALAAVLIVYATVFFLRNQQQQLAQRQAELSSTILSQDSVERSYVILSKKVSILSDLFARRSNKQETIAFFTTLFGPQVLIKNVNYQADSSILILGLEINDVFTLDTVLAHLEDPQVAGRFAQLTTSELTRGSNGQYALTLSLVLDKSKLAKPAATTPTVSTQTPGNPGP